MIRYALVSHQSSPRAGERYIKDMKLAYSILPFLEIEWLEKMGMWHSIENWHYARGKSDTPDGGCRSLLSL